ncbi:hypothetical protein D9M71_816250 [compost metagenome]
MIALAEVLVQGLQQAQAGIGSAGPVDQRALLKVFEGLFQAAGFDGHAHRAFTEQRRGAGIERVEQQATGR